MPLARYFFFVGGVLLALLFTAGVLAPELTVAPGNNGKHSTIRIHSEQKLPERVVYDTSLPMTVSVQMATAEITTPALGRHPGNEGARCPEPGEGGVCAAPAVRRHPAATAGGQQAGDQASTQSAKEVRGVA